MCLEKINYLLSFEKFRDIKNSLKSSNFCILYIQTISFLPYKSIKPSAFNSDNIPVNFTRRLRETNIETYRNLNLINRKMYLYILYNITSKALILRNSLNPMLPKTYKLRNILKYMKIILAVNL